MSEVELYNATHLKELYCIGGQLRSFRFSTQSPLEVLRCSHYNSQQISVDISNCKNLRILDCSNYRMSSETFDMALPQLTELYLNDGHSFKKIDLTNCPNIKEIEIVDFTYDSKLEMVTATNLKKLKWATVQGYQSDFDKPSKVVADFTGCDSLEHVRSYAIKKLIVTKCPKLRSDYIEINPF